MKNYYREVKDSDAKKNLNRVDYCLRWYNEGNKKKVQYKSEIRSFCGDYLDIGVRYNEGYTLYNDMSIDVFEKRMKEGTIYIVNPCSINRYYKQKWYQNPKS